MEAFFFFFFLPHYIYPAFLFYPISLSIFTIAATQFLQMDSEPAPHDIPNSSGSNEHSSTASDNSSHSVDIDACQASSVGMTLFRLFNGTAGHSLHLASLNEDSDDSDSETEEGVQNVAPQNITSESQHMPQLVSLDGISNGQQHDIDANPITPTSSSYPNTITPSVSNSSHFVPFITVSNTDSVDTGMSKLAQSVQSLVINHNSARRGSRASIKTTRSVKSTAATLNTIPDEFEDSKRRAGHIAETLKSLGVHDDDVLIAGMFLVAF